MLAGSCIPAEPDEDRMVRYDEDTVMGQVQAAGELRVGLQEGPPFAAGGATSEGFNADMATFVAEELGVEASFRFATGHDLPRLVANDVVDIAFPLTPITARAVREGVTAFADPHYVTHQRLLVPDGSRIDDVEDLANETVCSLVEEQIGVELDDLEPAIEVVDAAEPGECAGALFGAKGGGESAVAAATGLDAELMQAAALLNGAGFQLRGDQLATAALGAIVERGSSAWLSFVNEALADAQEDGRWLRSYREWLAPFLDEASREPPTLTVEEAAALFPQD